MKFFKTVGTWGVGTACLLHRLDPQFVVHKSAGFQFLHLHSASAIIVFCSGVAHVCCARSSWMNIVSYIQNVSTKADMQNPCFKIPNDTYLKLQFMVQAAGIFGPLL